MIASDGPDWIVRLGGRRFVLSIGAALVTSWLTWAGRVDGGIYAAVVLGTVGAYITGNTVQRVREIREAGAAGEIGEVLQRPALAANRERG